MRCILFLSDTLNRRLFDIYDSSGLHLKNLDRLIERSIVFDSHYVGSAPCMPARRDIMTGRLNFLERNWGGIEPYDWTLPQALREHGIKSYIFTDHYHYLEVGGENYLTMFDGWVMPRGQAKDPCCSKMTPVDQEYIGAVHPQFWANHNSYKGNEKEYPTPRTISRATTWLEENHEKDEFLLWIEPFDPHEPFDVPDEYLKQLGDDYDGPLFVCPKYSTVEEAGITERELKHIRNRYKALLLMMDNYLGGLFDVMDRHDMWKDTAFIFTTDHGYMLGEHGFMAKNYMPAYNEVFNIPLIVHLPGDEQKGRRIDALTQNIDIMPTVLELFKISLDELPNRIHGRSWMPLVKGESEAVRDCAIYGYFGKAVNITDGRYTYFRAPVEGNRPLNVYTAMPMDLCSYFDRKRVYDIGKIEMGRFLSWTDYPVYRFSADNMFYRNGPLRYTVLNEHEKKTMLFDLEKDPEQNENLCAKDRELETAFCMKLAKAMKGYDAPEEQYIRLSLQDYCK